MCASARLGNVRLSDSSSVSLANLIPWSPARGCEIIQGAHRLHGYTPVQTTRQSSGKNRKNQELLKGLATKSETSLVSRGTVLTVEYSDRKSTSRYAQRRQKIAGQTAWNVVCHRVYQCHKELYCGLLTCTGRRAHITTGLFDQLD